MNGVTNTQRIRTAAMAAALLVTCLPVGWARGQQHNNAPRPAPHRSAPAPHYSQPQGRSNGPQYRAPQNRPQMRTYPQSQSTPQYRPIPQANGRYQGIPQAGYPGSNARPAYPGSGNPASGTPYGNQRENYGNGQPYNGSQPYGGSQRPAYTGQGTAPRGHLQDWLTQHQNVPVQDQERMLRSDPSFKRLPQGDQQRLTQQLRQVDKMPAPQRDLRLQRNEMLERLSPEERMSINRSGRQWAALPADRQTQVRRAFQDLRGVPLDQRQTVLNSARYQGQFTPEERGILSDFLRVEPYQPVH